MCHYCRADDDSVMIKCRCSRCDGMEQDVCAECGRLWWLAKKDFPKNYRAAWDELRARVVASRR